MYVDKLTNEVILEFEKRACCLIPEKEGILCHEYDFCGCEVLALIKSNKQLNADLDHLTSTLVRMEDEIEQDYKLGRLGLEIARLVKEINEID